MADIVDYANDLIQLHINATLNNRAPKQLIHYQACRNCENPTEHGHAFCSSECRDDFEKRDLFTSQINRVIDFTSLV